MTDVRSHRKRDLVTMGRAIVDIYGDQVGCRLEDVASFSKYVGGCPANIAIGVSRLGMRVGMITRVGDEHHGRFIREQLQREGVDTTYVLTDPSRLTGVAFLGIRDQDTFPLLHYRADCADMAIEPGDYASSYLGDAKALLVSGSHLTTAGARHNVTVAIDRAHASATRVVFDIDFRPVFWGLTRLDAGENRFVQSAEVTAFIQPLLARCHLIVGTEEEIHIAGGTQDTLGALKRIRELSAAALVLKRGSSGCVVFPAAIPATVDEGIAIRGFPVDVFNVVGAGDGFMSGFLTAWLKDASWSECGRTGNACGALVVSRHGCAPASPTAVELDWFLNRPYAKPDLFRNRELAEIHRASTRRRRPPIVHLISCEAIPRSETASVESDARYAQFIAHLAEAVIHESVNERGLGIILDPSRAMDTLFRVGTQLAWIGRSIDVSRGPALQFHDDLPASLIIRRWPRDQIVKCRMPVGRHIRSGINAERLHELYCAIQEFGNELAIELVAATATGGSPSVIEQMHDIDASEIHPDWWMLPEGLSDAEWTSIDTLASSSSRHCRGILIVRASLADCVPREAQAPQQYSSVRGEVLPGDFVRQLWQDWISGRISDKQAKLDLSKHVRDALQCWRIERAAAFVDDPI